MPLIAESDERPRLITAREGGGYGLTAQWSDDFHHALYVSLTGDTSGYYADFDSLPPSARCLKAASSIPAPGPASEAEPTDIR